MSSANSPARVVAFGGGHGLSATLRAVTQLLASREISDLTAIVGVSDDGGSSGRIRTAFDVIPPGDLRMAICSLLPQDEVGVEVGSILQYRFPVGASNSGLEGHVVGNILLTALWNSGMSAQQGLDLVGKFLGVRGRVLPCSSEPIDLVATIAGINPADPAASAEVSGQVGIATTTGVVQRIRVQPSAPAVCEESVVAISEADLLIFGPGSWFTSVVPPLLVPGIRKSVINSAAHRVLITNLSEQIGETTGFTVSDYLSSWKSLFSDISLDAVVVDPNHHGDHDDLERAANLLGAKVFRIDVAAGGATHDPNKLANALRLVATELGSK